MPTRLWWRLVKLLAARGQVSPQAERMAKHATHYATDGGWLGDIEDAEQGLIPGYKARFDLGRRTAYTDLERLAVAGLLRKTRGACPGRTVGYQMCAPQTLPADLPASLARELRKLWGLLERDDDQAEQQPPSLSEVASSTPETRKARIPAVRRHALLAQCEAVRYGASRHATALCSESFRGRLHTSPLLKRVLSHPLRPAQMGSNSSEGVARGQELYDERGLARSVIGTCRARWAATRAGMGLSSEAEQRLVPLVAGALRYLASPDVVEVMTRETSTARDIGAICAHRLRQVIKAGRRCASIVVDDSGEQWAARQAAHAAEALRLHQQTASTRAVARAEAEAARTRFRSAAADRKHHRAEQHAVRPPVAQPGRQGRPAAVLHPQVLAELAQAQANARAAYSIRQPIAPAKLSTPLALRPGGVETVAEDEAGVEHQVLDPAAVLDAQTLADLQRWTAEARRRM
jgi:hypothetical protein